MQNQKMLKYIKFIIVIIYIYIYLTLIYTILNISY